MPTPRLPTVNGDNNNWGTILNDFLLVSHNSDGTLSSTQVATASRTVSIQSGSYTPSATISEIILVNAASGPITVTVPAAGSNNHLYCVKKTDTTSNNVTIATTSSQTIDGGSTAVLRVPYVSVTLVSNGTNWNVI